MSLQIAFLRGVGHSPADSIDMPALREALAAAGLTDPRTHRESGNVLIVSGHEADELARRVSAVIEDRFRRHVHVIVRSHKELDDVVSGDPFADVVTEPERYHVAFLDDAPAAGEAEKLASLTTGGERVAVIDRTLYAWHPAGVTGSRLIDGIRALTVPATARDWPTVTTLLALADEMAAAHAAARQQ